jgi:hypothetical protein
MLDLMIVSDAVRERMKESVNLDDRGGRSARRDHLDRGPARSRLAFWAPRFGRRRERFQEAHAEAGGR